MKKIDVHCHILPGLDDGSSSVEESLKMLKLAFDQGIDTVIATSHASVQFPKSRPEAIIRQCELLQQKARQEIHPDFRIYPGQEILFTDNILGKLEEGELLTVAGSIYILVEFLPATPYSVIYRGVRELCMSPYQPILAHIERYHALRKDDRVEELIESGALMQMNYRSIAGRWYEETARWCRRMLTEQNIHFLATDMHNAGSRAPQTEGAMRWMERHLEESYLEEICHQNAKMLLSDTKNKL